MEQEVRLIHKASWTSIKTLYLCCRYYPLCVWFFVMWAYVGDHDWETCDRTARIVHALLAPYQFFSQAVMVMRAFAFTGRNRRIFILLGMCYLGLVGVDLWAFCTYFDTIPPIGYALLGGTGCFPNYVDAVIGLRIGYSMLAATLMDLLSLVVVVVHCFRSRWDRDVPLARYFVNQGLTAFAFVTVVNVATAVLYFRPPAYHNGIGLPMILVVSNLVACRMILQLRGQVTPTQTELSRRHSSIVRNALFSSEGDSWIFEREE
ncbi:hypothetical protein GALMADRAFT_241325 [Galerina marginata CBS 339.88]|uniref:Uncharacterized protein n=1 Tax=Galerina marginata (strain CBS 339.88) TaxID=685588 RepID=A0A067TER5_GALM3|nr:hypothetical protein GALMADRAFT_241325 [Galerina marginata CBS 339.88]